MSGMESVAEANGSTAASIPAATNPMVTPLFTDQYQFTMAYAYWKAGKHQERAVFDLFFRKSPFGGEYTVFGGLEECIRFVANFKLEEDEISFLQSVMPGCEDGFFEFLREVDCSDVEVYAIPEGSVVFPKMPLMRVEGPVAVVQLLETPFVNLVNFASLVTTNAARHRLVAGHSKTLLEFGLRRAQGPDGGMSASRYCYIGGFDATSNVAAGKLFGIPLCGTHSHAFVSSFMSPNEIVSRALQNRDSSSTCKDFVNLVQTWLSKLQGHEIDAYGIGTHLVTCYSQAALGCVFKLVEIKNQPRMKLSEDITKVSIPCKKRCFRLYGREGFPLVDIMIGVNEPLPKVGERILCRHPFIESKRAYVVPQHVEELLKCYWPGKTHESRVELPSLQDIRNHCMQQLQKMRSDHMRRLNPTPYKVSVSGKLYDFIHFLWLNEAPVGELQ